MTEPIQSAGEALPDDKPMSSQAKWNAAHPKEMWAHQALRSAIGRGLIERQPCEVCGEAKTDAHHDDYDRPLLIRWLCRLHHRAVHRELKCEAANG